VARAPHGRDHGVERAGQPGLVHIVLILTDADGLGLDLDELGERILQATCDRDRAAQAHVEVRRRECCGRAPPVTLRLMRVDRRGLNELPSLIERRVAEQRVAERLEPGFARDLRLGPALRLRLSNFYFTSSGTCTSRSTLPISMTVAATRRTSRRRA
jgi:hypothetical protein